MSEINFKNRSLFHGDNLHFLRGMNSETIDLVATDPPFNKNRDFHATPDSLSAGASFQDRWSWRDDIHDEWVIQIQRDHYETWHVINAAKNVYGYDMAAFLCWLGVRLLEMHRILKPTGSIYIHIDHTAHAWVKALMDAIFGQHNFRNEIVWRRMGAHNDYSQGARHFGRIHDTLLRYSKGKNPTWNVVHEPYSKEYIKKTYNYKDSDGRRYQIQPLHAAKPGGDTSYEWKGRKPPPGRYWAYSKANMERMDAEGRIHYSKTGNPSYKIYLDESKGRTLQDLWDDIPAVYRKRNENTGYPTQKPLALYERIVKASSNTGDWVLDPFCGCATTPVAAERQGRNWVGIDIWDKAHEIVLERLEANRQLLSDPDPKIFYSTTPPVRTDRGDPAVLYLQTPTGKAGAKYPAPRSQHSRLVADIGPFCQGCGRDYNFDPRVLEVDHVMPRSDGGTDAYENLTLLCPPCNKDKRDRLTLSGLQEVNRQNGHLTTDRDINIRRGRATIKKRKRRR